MYNRGGTCFMEYAKSEMFNVNYNTKINRIETKKEKWIIILLKKIKKHKFFSTIVIAFISFSIINIVMIWNFMRICYNNLSYM